MCSSGTALSMTGRWSACGTSSGGGVWTTNARRAAKSTNREATKILAAAGAFVSSRFAFFPPSRLRDPDLFHMARGAQTWRPWLR